MADEDVTGTNVVSDAMKIAEQKIAFWGAMAKFIGWPGVILILMGYGAYRTGSAAWPYFVDIATTHVKVVEGLQDTQKQLVSQQAQQNELREESNKIMSKLSENQEAQGLMLRDIHNAVVKQQKE
jgi:hypothetical protein